MTYFFIGLAIGLVFGVFLADVARWIRYATDRKERA